MPRPARMPKGTVTFLFSDIEGSTRMWEENPGAMQTALARHDTLLREAIEENGGYVFKTVGDAFCAAFSTALEAVQAAIDAQRAVRATDWQALGVGPVKVRMALHTGVAEVRDKDYFGLPLNRVSRLLSAGYGGQILLSLPTQQLVRDQLPPGIALKDLGEGALRDLVYPEHVYQIITSDLAIDFPPIKTLDSGQVIRVADRSGIDSDLEIGVHRWDSDNYAVELRFSQPGSEGEIALTRGLARFDLEGLRSEADIEASGKLLTTSLFASPAVREAFSRARASAEQMEGRLRVRLFIGPSAPELQSLHWETLHDPRQMAAPLLTNESILFSRYLTSLDWRPVRPRPKGDLRALVVIANPAELSSDGYKAGDRRLTPLDVKGEMDRAQYELGGIPITALASGGTATLNNMTTQLREGHDILYLVCHGAMMEGEPRLWLEDEDGRAAVVAGSEIATRLGELQERPRLVVLASCQSGEGDEVAMADGSALAAIAPRLAEAGIPAVLAMQGAAAVSTVAEFTTVFFHDLQRYGQVDRAMAAARHSVEGQPDYWVPVLFVRLKSGSIWYVPGFAGERPDRPDFTKWPALLRNVYDSRCTPILGSGLLEGLIGSTHDLAQRWAETYHFPLAPYAREDLPQVAQYLAVDQQFDMPNRELTDYVRLELLQRFSEKLPPEARGARIEPLLSAVGAYLRSRSQPPEPHKVLASLPFPIYVTTNPDNLLADALTEVGKSPKVELCRWNSDLNWPPSVYDINPNYEPTVKEPLVYHLFGHWKLLESVVLKEDDYFDYLIGVTSNRTAIPDDVRRALTDTALLFLGFRMDDWDFRALFRSLMGQEGRNRRSRYAHVAAQISPEEGRNLNPEGARRYLQDYFEGAYISIYWGRVDDFVGELETRWQAYLNQRERGGVA
ncbi:MAG: CHAT domain-containing protein [Chloroflexia bacterium]